MMTRTSEKQGILGGGGTVWLALFASVLVFLAPANAVARTRSEICSQAARAIVNQVLPGGFGGVCAIVAGVLALVAAAAGSYRGTWALIFVCLACVLANNLVGLLFPL